MSPKVTPLDKHIAARIKQMRAERKQTQPGVAGVLGVSYQSYQKMERGAVSFRASTLDKLAILFGVPVAHFFGDAPAPDLPNGEQIATVVNIIKGVDTTEANGIVDCVVRARGGQRAAVQAGTDNQRGQRRSG